MRHLRVATLDALLDMVWIVWFLLTHFDWIAKIMLMFTKCIDLYLAQQRGLQ